MKGGLERRQAISSPGSFGKVAVLYGGNSSEREVSLMTGKAVFDALVSRGVDAQLWDPAERGVEGLAEVGIDRAWIALHGTGGEDGAIQGALQWLQIPYTGSGVMASALAMDKERSKRLFVAAGIPTPPYEIIRSRAEAVHVAEEMGFPLIFKPSCEGSSVGMSKAFEPADVPEAAETALGYGSVAIVERCIVGDEITVSVLQGEALPSIRIETPRVFYDYRAKYESDRTEYHCPGTTSDIAEAKFAELALRAFELLGCEGWGRVDFMVDSDDQPQVLEVNTVPGMTSHSLVPMAAKAVGIDFAELCWRILETSVEADAQARKEVANGS
ncbi:MAG: D-alanine--D-alanine ligase [Woeseiaceae bacterium]|nr:D-alanine--D-alanine ligase [Woeseiaceae bacterium]